MSGNLSDMRTSSKFCLDLVKTSMLQQWLGREKSQWANAPMLTQINGPFQISMGHGIKCMGHQWVSISKPVYAENKTKTILTLFYSVFLHFAIFVFISLFFSQCQCWRVLKVENDTSI